MQPEPADPWRIAALVRVAAACALLGPAALAARVAGAALRARCETEMAASALAALGVCRRPLAIARLGGGRSNAVYRLRFADRTLVLKQALPVGTVLALAARWVGSQPFARGAGLLANARLISQAGRIANEAGVLETLRRAGVRVPRVVAANPPAGLLLLEHVEGEPLPATLARPHAARRIAAYARALRAVHAAGVTLGDCHPGNALVARDGSITLVDFELADMRDAPGTFRARCAFDIAFAAAYFTAGERAAFLAAAGANPAITGAAAELDRFAPLFARERRLQRLQRLQRVPPLQRTTAVAA